MTAAVALETPPPVVIASDLLGPLSVEASAVVQFPRGVLGFPDCHAFALLATEREHVYWLQSVEHASLAFLLIDPFIYFPGYVVDLATTELEHLPLAPNRVMVLAIVTLPPTAADRPTANLQGPVAIDVERGEGYQVVLGDGPFGIRESFTL